MMFIPPAPFGSPLLPVRGKQPNDLIKQWDRLIFVAQCGFWAFIIGLPIALFLLTIFGGLHG
jgi:hypothetical protein